MKKIIFISLLVLTLAASGWAADTIKIGSLTALTGGLAPFGPPIDYGAKLAAAQINAAGGIFGKKVEIITRDTGTAPAVGRDAATKLIEIDIKPKSFILVYIPFRLKGNELSYPEYRLRINKNVLRFARHL